MVAVSLSQSAGISTPRVVHNDASQVYTTSHSLSSAGQSFVGHTRAALFAKASPRVDLVQRSDAFTGPKAVLDVPSGKAGGFKGVRDNLVIPGQSQSDVDYVSAEQRIFEVVVKDAANTFLAKPIESEEAPVRMTPKLLEDAYVRCGEVCAEYAKTFYLGTKLMTSERRNAIWAIYVWCRRTDELVDGPNASHITPRALDRWEERLDDLFAGRPYDMLDAALSDTIRTYPMSIQPFRDMIDGMRMDLRKSRYRSFDELYVYCYNVAGTVGLMSVPVMGIDPASKAPVADVYKAALDLGIANQLTNILRDVGEDAQRGRVYLPQDELAQFGLSDEDIFEGKVTPKWRSFMKFQIERARNYFKTAEAGVYELDGQSRWPVLASLHLYAQILDAVEANDYDNFTRRAYVSKMKKFMSLPGTFITATKGPSSS